MELTCQKFIREHGLSALVEQHGIEIVEKDDLVLLNYNMINSPKNEVTASCRSTILRRDTWDVVSFSFHRFFNFGETQAAKIDWLTAKFHEKLDGSLVVIYTHSGTTRVQTRGTIDATGPLYGGLLKKEQLGTYFDAVINILHSKGLTLNDFRDDEHCFAFEFVGPLNKHVTRYGTNDLVLLNVINKRDLFCPISIDDGIIQWPVLSKFRRPKLYDLTEKTMVDFSAHEKDFEGYVVVDANNNRIKVKNPTYVILHKTINAGGKISTNAIIDAACGGDYEELFVYVPELKPVVMPLVNRINELDNMSKAAWKLYKDMPRKEFAVALFKTFQGNEATVAHFLCKKYADHSLTYHAYFKSLSGQGKLRVLSDVIDA